LDLLNLVIEHRTELREGDNGTTKIITEYKIGGGMSTNKAKIYMTYITVNTLNTGYHTRRYR